jgi:tetratricopeptide (TPR) repeat protein
MDKFDEVTSEAEKAIQINPNLSEAYKSLGWIYSSMGKLNDGVMNLRRAYKLDPLSFRPGSEVTLVCQLAGRERDAIELLQRLKDLYPRNHRVYARWAEFYMLKQDFVNAQQMLDTGLQISSRRR